MYKKKSIKFLTFMKIMQFCSNLGGFVPAIHEQTNVL